MHFLNCRNFIKALRTASFFELGHLTSSTEKFILIFKDSDPCVAGVPINLREGNETAREGVQKAKSSPLLPNFLLPQACFFARPLFRILSPLGNGKETAATQAILAEVTRQNLFRLSNNSPPLSKLV